MKRYRVSRVTALGIAGLLAVAAAARTAAGAPAAVAPSYLYKATFMRAAPGRLLELIDLIKGRRPVMDAAGDARPLWWRHMEGDQWDLMIITPMGSYGDYYAKDRLARRDRAAAAAGLSERDFGERLGALVSWQEDVFVMGPPLEAVEKEFNSATFYHIEMFVALPGKKADLCKEREMENVYQVGIGRPATMTFVRDQGAAWDMFSLGCYRDLKHWAGTDDVSKEKKEEAARKAGFAGAGSVGPTMRTLIDWHRDTIGGAIK
jgi:hypothetical protein